MRTGTIGFITDEVARYTAFLMCAFATNAPGWKVHTSMGRNITRNCNKLVQKFKGDMLWFQADDHVWDSDALLRLEAHGVDCVVPLMLMRQKPFHPVIFDKLLDDGSYRIYEEPPPNELIEVEAAGTGGMLITRDALDAVGPNPFSFGLLENGEYLGEDLQFCQKLKAAGIQIHCDTSVWMGHLSTTAIWPDYTEDGWAVRLDLNSGAK